MVLRGCQAKHAARFRGLGGFDCGLNLLSVETWGWLGDVYLKRCETFGARVLRCSLRRGFIDEGAERDRSSRVLSCYMTIEPSLDKKERLFGSPW